jgi:hypothetical protein
MLDTRENPTRNNEIRQLFNSRNLTEKTHHKHETMTMKMAVFWVVAPCSLVELYQRFRETAIFILTAVKTSNPTTYQ